MQYRNIPTVSKCRQTSSGWDQGRVWADVNIDNYFRYFTATMEGSPGVRHVYRVSDDGSGAPECLTCPPHTDCLYTEASIAPGGAAYIQVSGADNGEIFLYFVF